MVYGKSKGLVKIIQPDKFLKDRAFEIASNPKYDGYQRGLASMVYKFFDKKSASLNKSIESGIINKRSYQLANELHKPIIRTFKKRKVYSSFRDNIWGVDLADMQSLSKYNKGNKYLLCAIDLFSRYAWVIPLKDKKGTRIVSTFQKIILEGKKPNKIWVDQGSEFYNSSFKDLLKINDIEMYSAYNEGESVVAERSIRTLKNKIFKHMTAISKNVYFDLLDDIQIGLERFLVLLKLKLQFLGRVVNDLSGEEITRRFYEKELQKTSQKEFRIEKVVKRKGEKLYVKRKRYDNRLNSWIDKKDLIRV